MRMFSSTMPFVQHHALESRAAAFARNHSIRMRGQVILESGTGLVLLAALFADVRSGFGVNSSLVFSHRRSCVE